LSKYHIRTNQQILAPEVRVIGAQGENLGVMPREQAQKTAQEQGLNLIEVAPLAKPPVCRIMSFDKYRYEAAKKEREERARQKNLEPKQIQISVREAKHDLELKAKKIDGFMAHNHPIVIVMTLRGREKGNRDFAKEKLGEFLKLIATPFQVITELRPGGRGLVMQIVKR
jgi:translation initiation factor IF-3